LGGKFHLERFDGAHEHGTLLNKEHRFMIDLSQLEELLCGDCHGPYIVACKPGHVDRFVGCRCDKTEFLLPEVAARIGIAGGLKTLYKRRAI
jgi:hypothetical protein